MAMRWCSALVSPAIAPLAPKAYRILWKVYDLIYGAEANAVHYLILFTSDTCTLHTLNNRHTYLTLATSFRSISSPDQRGQRTACHVMSPKWTELMWINPSKSGISVGIYGNPNARKIHATHPTRFVRHNFVSECFAEAGPVSFK